MNNRPRRRRFQGNQNLKAACPGNQAILDQLVRQRSARDGGNFTWTLQRAIGSVQQCPQAITSYQQAMALKHVGPYLANVMMGSRQERVVDSSSSNSNSRSDGAGTRKRAQTSSLLTTTTTTTPTSEETTTNDESAREKRRRKPPPPVASSSSNSSSLVATASSSSSSCSTKERAYQQTIAHALDWKQQYTSLHWKVVLLVDGRERKSQHIQAKCQMSGIPCQERHLPIGDMAWIVQGITTEDDNNNNNNNHIDNAVAVELMLGTIIERKTTADLKASLFGTRYAEQRLRLQHCGLPQVLFLIEGNFLQQQQQQLLFRCPADTLHSAMWETRLHLGFGILQTAHLDDTVQTLKRMHRRILQRTFPSAFYRHHDRMALPTFTEAVDARETTTAKSTTRSRRQSTSSTSSSSGSKNYRRRRRNIHSLVEMTFDVEPTLALGMERFITYAELKAKVERDREAATKSVGKIHLAMLKQVPTCSSKKCHAVQQSFPTAHCLLAAYDQDESEEHRKSLVADADICTNDNRQATARDLKIGLRSAEELYIAYGIADAEDEALRQGQKKNKKSSASDNVRDDGDAVTKNPNAMESAEVARLHRASETALTNNTTATSTMPENTGSPKPPPTRGSPARRPLLRQERHVDLLETTSDEECANNNNNNNAGVCLNNTSFWDSSPSHKENEDCTQKPPPATTTRESPAHRPLLRQERHVDLLETTSDEECVNNNNDAGVGLNSTSFWDSSPPHKENKEGWSVKKSRRAAATGLSSSKDTSTDTTLANKRMTRRSSSSTPPPDESGTLRHLLDHHDNDRLFSLCQRRTRPASLESCASTNALLLLDSSDDDDDDDDDYHNRVTTASHPPSRKKRGTEVEVIELSD